MLRFTDQAAQALVRSDAAARRFNPDARVRLVPDTGRGVRAQLVDGPESGDRLQQIPDGPQVFVHPSLDGSVDVGEHDALILTAEA
jgi:plasmid stabilization system protein ParE